MLRRLLTYSFLLIFSGLLQAQKSEKISFSCQQQKMENVLKQLEQLYDVKFSYAPELIEGIIISLDEQKRTLTEILLDISLQTHIRFNPLDGKYFYLVQDQVETLQKVIVQSYLTKGIAKKNDGSFVYSIKNFGLLPGLTDNDILESVQLLPGIANIDESATNFYVRGGLPDQNRLIWDGINIYHNGHLFGLISPFNPNTIDKVSFYYKGTPVYYGERAASVIDMKTYENIPHKTHLEWGINGISSDAVIRLPVIKNKLSFQASFRRSYEDFFETPVFTKYEAKAFQNATLNNDRFYFKDYHFKVNLLPGPNHKIFLSYLHIDNDLQNNYFKDNASVTNFLDTENTGFSAKWLWQINKKIRWNNLISNSEYSLIYNNKIIENQLTTLDFHKQNYISDFFVSTFITQNINKQQVLEWGLQFSQKQVNYKLTEQKNVLLILDESAGSSKVYSGFVNYRLTKPDFDISLGLRSNYYAQLKQVKWEPRLVFNRKINKKLRLQFTGEIKNQIISQIRTSLFNSFTIEDKIWQLSDGQDKPVISSYHVTTGAIFQHKSWLIDFDLYYKQLNGISSYTLGLLNPVDNRLHTGEQQTAGFDIFIKKRFNRFKTRFSYTFSDIRNKFDGFNDDKYFTAASDIKHSFSSVFSYRYKKLDLALGWRFRLGKPTSEIEDDDDEYYLEEINEYRLANYHRLDFSSSYAFSLSKKHKIKAKAGLSVRNLLNHKIVINQDFVGNESLNDPVGVLNYYSLGITPNVMFRVFW